MSLQWKLGYEHYSYAYEEPGVMQNRANFDGAVFSVTYRRYLMLRLEGRWAKAKVDYSSSSSAKIKNIDDRMYELRGLFGYNFYLHNSIVTPFVGYAYRYLNDDSENMYSTAGEIGYDRESNYYYSPIGLEFISYLDKNWIIGSTVEYDYLWHGIQYSYLGYVPGYWDIKNKQYHGYGARISFLLARKINRSAYLGIEPFYRYWRIEDSRIDVDPAGRKLMEPYNRTTELGIQLFIMF